MSGFFFSTPFGSCDACDARKRHLMCRNAHFWTAFCLHCRCHVECCLHSLRDTLVIFVFLVLARSWVQITYAPHMRTYVVCGIHTRILAEHVNNRVEEVYRFTCADICGEKRSTVCARFWAEFVTELRSWARNVDLYARPKNNNKWAVADVN